MRKSLFILSIITSGLLSLPNTTLADQQKVANSPFTDYVQALIQIPGGTASLSYVNDNDVNITGPSATAMGLFNFSIYSSNQIEYGNPQLIVTYNGIACTLRFVDGPATPLGYQNNTLPVCSNFTVSPISYNLGNQMHYLSIAYHS